MGMMERKILTYITIIEIKDRIVLTYNTIIGTNGENSSHIYHNNQIIK